MELNILLNRVAEQKTWVRSSEERDFLNQATDAMSMALEFVSMYEDLTWKHFFVEDFTKGELLEKLRKGDSITLNLCVGIELDGIAGSTVTMFLESNNISFIGPSTLFQTKTLDKMQMKQILASKSLEMPKYIILKPNCSTSIIDGLNYPLRIRPADSIAAVGKNGMDLISIKHNDCQQVIARLRKNFPLILVEEHITNAKNIWFLISNHPGTTIGTVWAQSDNDEQAKAMALTAYNAFELRGHAVIQISYDYTKQRYLVNDIFTNNALLWASRVMGKQTIFTYLYKVLCLVYNN